MNVVLNPIKNSNTKFNLSLSSRYLDLDLQDLQFAYLENDEDMVMHFEMNNQDESTFCESFEIDESASISGVIEYSKNRDMVIMIN